MSRTLPSRIVFAVPYPVGKASSQRFRFEQFFGLLDERGVEYECAPFWGERAWKILFDRGRTISKAAGLFAGFIRRLVLMTRLHRYDVVYVHRGMTPVGPPLFEWLTARVFGKTMVYDFDDAIWLENVSSANPVAGAFKSYGKVSKICGWSARVSVGNDYLARYAGRYCNDVVVVPSVVDTENYHIRAKEPENEVPVVGWTGTHSTVRYLEPAVPFFRELSRRTRFDMVVVADRAPDFDLPNMRFVLWNKETEIDDLTGFDVGIMPLPDDDWARGKCGFKIIQYMALGIPPVASPVGVNASIIDDGIDGFLCDSGEDWTRALKTLLADEAARKRMGKAAREKAVEKYSVAANAGSFLSSIEGLSR